MSELGPSGVGANERALADARAASENHWQRARHAENVIYRLLLLLDSVATTNEVIGSPQWLAASHVIGWDVDWEALANGRPS